MAFGNEQRRVELLQVCCAILHRLAYYLGSVLNQSCLLASPFLTRVSFELSFASDLVLLLQGFWNTVIFATPLPACKALLSKLVEKVNVRREVAGRSESMAMDGSERKTVANLQLNIHDC